MILAKKDQGQLQYKSAVVFSVTVKDLTPKVLNVKFVLDFFKKKWNENAAKQ